MYLLKDISVCLGEKYDDKHVCANFGYDLQYVSTIQCTSLNFPLILSQALLVWTYVGNGFVATQE